MLVLFLMVAAPYSQYIFQSEYDHGYHIEIMEEPVILQVKPGHGLQHYGQYIQYDQRDDEDIDDLIPMLVAYDLWMQ
jgi:hypothetical protein